jgi:DNA-binding response OmpR family regulator
VKKRIFIIDDEKDMIGIATALLEDNGYVVRSASHPNEGIRQIQANPPDLILLDVALPDKDGFEVCKELKAHPATRSIPVIMISVRSDETNVVVGLEIGAVDYVTKPFRKHELLARIKSALTRSGEPASSAPIKSVSGPVEIDIESRMVKVHGESIQLTRKEFDLLALFVSNTGKVLRRQYLLESVWGYEFDSMQGTIDSHMKTLRKKLGTAGSLIETVTGVGYRWNPPS